jgi:hypothetical protein
VACPFGTVHRLTLAQRNDGEKRAARSKGQVGPGSRPG